MLLLSSLLFCVFFSVHSTIINTAELKCPTGWLPYRDSCYFFENPILDFEKAQGKCWEMGATLLVAETLDEYEFVTQLSKSSTWSWIGLTQDDEHHSPRWSNTGGIDATSINWLVKPFIAVSNGWSPSAKCAAHLNVPITSSDYTFYMPCTIQVYSICEKNATLFPHIWDHGLVGL